MPEITQLLHRVQTGDASCLNELFETIYRDLYRIASKQKAAHGQGSSLQPTALVNEVYLKLFGTQEQRMWHSRKHFLCAAALTMQHILVDQARAKTRLKRGGGRKPERISHVANLLSAEEPSIYGEETILAVQKALSELAELAPRKAELVRLRYFAGLTSEQAAEVLDISRATAVRDWAFARAWLVAKIAEMA